MKRPRPKTKTHRAPKPAIPAELLADVARMFAEHQLRVETKRLEVFERAWKSLEGVKVDSALRVSLAVAYLGGSK